MSGQEFRRSLGLLLARLALGAIFLYAGYHNIGRIEATAKTLAGMHYPAPKLLAIIAALAELAGGISLVAGFLTPIGCVALILFLIPTTWSFHVPGLRSGDHMQTIQTLKNVAILAGLGLLAAMGPGGFSVDRRRKGG